MGDKLKKSLSKIAFDAIGIIVCTIVAELTPKIVPALEGMETSVGVAAGIWIYMPVRGLINKVARKK